MNSNRLAELIFNPSLCTAEEVSELTALAVQYPYSAAIHILNSRIAALRDQNNREDLLTRAAVSTSDRMQLKKYMTSASVFENYHFVGMVKIENETIFAEPVVEEIIKPAPAKETAQEEITERDQPRETNESKSETETEMTGTRKPAEVRPASVREIAAHKEVPSDAGELKRSKLAEELMENIASYREARAKFERMLDEKPEVTKPEIAKPEVTKPEKPAEAGPIEIGNVDEKFREIIKPIQKKKSTKKMAKEEQDLLISKFIETDSGAGKSVKPGNKKKQNEEDLSLPSSELSDEMVTETLANILINQGKFEKAIDIYRKLIWKLPQKKTYFAGRIESLKEIIAKK